jgi:hypothetical protein
MIQAVAQKTGGSIRNEAATMRSTGDRQEAAGAGMLGRIVQKGDDRAKDALNNIGGAAKSGFDAGQSHGFDVSGAQSDLDTKVGAIMDHVQKVSKDSLAKFPDKKGSGSADESPSIDPEEKKREEEKKAYKGSEGASRLQKIGGGGGVFRFPENPLGRVGSKDSKQPGANSEAKGVEKTNALLEQCRKILDEISKEAKKERSPNVSTGVFAYP